MDGHTISITKSEHYVLSNKSLFTFIMVFYFIPQYSITNACLSNN